MMLIGIDHGNKQIKTAHSVMVSGLTKHDAKPIAGEMLLFDGCYYTPSENRLPFAWDKTKNEDFFILSLFAIAHELEERGVCHDGSAIPIDLAVGLPPADYGKMHQRFEEYFRRPRSVNGVTEFELNGKTWCIQIGRVMAFPQDYAAAITDFSAVRAMRRAVVLDIGGMTADYLLLNSGKLDLSVCGSLEHGIITLYNRITEQVRGDYGMLLDDDTIDQLLQHNDVLGSPEIMQLTHRCATAFARDLLGKLRERQIDLRITPTVFVGGGAIRLYPFFKATGMLGQSSLIENICANALGYEKLFKASQQISG
jgi:plasmid segregation protein ParM